MCDVRNRKLALSVSLLAVFLVYVAVGGAAPTAPAASIADDHAGHAEMAGMEMGTSRPASPPVSQRTLAGKPPVAQEGEPPVAQEGKPPVAQEGKPAAAQQGEPPVAQEALPGYTAISIPQEVQQRIGVTTGRVKQGPLVMAVRAVGILRPNETKLTRVHLKTEGWVSKLFVSFTGQKVKKGDPLLSIYSPQFLVAQQEYVTALRNANAVSAGGLDAKGMIEAARSKLELLDIPKEEIEQLQRTGEIRTTLMLRALADGTVLEKKAFEGQYVKPDDELYVLADLSTIWVQAKVYEYELPHVVVGQPATVRLPSQPGRELTGKVVFVDPVVEEPSRTAQVRIELPNPQGKLKPGMFAHVVITHPMGDGLLVPTEAVIRSGDQDIAFRVEQPGRFVPVKVQINPMQFGDFFEILDGLHAGDQVVTSANFLIDSESRLQAGAGGGMAGMPGMEMGGMEDEKPDGSKSVGLGGKQSMPAMQHHH